MKILHTSDWHLGAKTFGRERLEEQKKVLDEIVSIANFENVDVVVVAGDVFSKKSPSSQTEKLFFEYAEKLSLGGDRFVFVLTGNHDEPSKIGFGNKMFLKNGIIPVADFSAINSNFLPKQNEIDVLETGKGYIKLQKGSDFLTLAFIPYFDDETGNYKETIAEKIETACLGFSEKSANIFAAHLFANGAKTTSKTNNYDYMQVDLSDIENCDYVALGHIHTHQKIGDNVYYCGGITKLSPSTEKLGVNIIETSSNKITEVRFVQLANAYRYEKVLATSIADATEKLEKYDDNDLVELEIYQDEPISALQISDIKRKYSCVCHISLFSNFDDANKGEIKKYRHLTEAKLFEKFYEEVSGQKPSEKLADLFLKCKGGNDETN